MGQGEGRTTADREEVGAWKDPVNLLPFWLDQASFQQWEAKGVQSTGTMRPPILPG